jgi:cellulose biosynthesis protein BcsQ
MILAIINNKGGAGKTASAVSLTGQIVKKRWTAWRLK